MTIISINYLGLQLSPFEINGSTEPLFDGASQKQMASEERTIIYAWFNVGFIADHCSKNQKNIIHSYAKIHDINHLYKYNDSFNSRIIAVSPEPATLLPLSLPKMNDPEFRQNERPAIQSGQCTGVKKT